jgi:hypothetical protein
MIMIMIMIMKKNDDDDDDDDDDVMMMMMMMMMMVMTMTMTMMMVAGGDASDGQKGFSRPGRGVLPAPPPAPPGCKWAELELMLRRPIASDEDVRQTLAAAEAGEWGKEWIIIIIIIVIIIIIIISIIIIIMGASGRS